MAELNFHGLDEFMLDMQQIAEIPEDIQSEMLNAQADVALKAQRQSIEAYQIMDTGKTLASLKKGKIKRSKKDGTLSIYITPGGSRKRGKKPTVTRNAEILFINEYGKKGKPGRPAIREANEKSAEATTKAGFEVYDRWLKSKDL